MDVHAYVCIIYMYVPSTYVCTYVRMYVPMYVCMYICMLCVNTGVYVVIR